MGKRAKKPWPVNSEHHAHMRKRQGQNRFLAKRNANEQWMAGKLKGTGYRWTPQAQWGFCLFDFWCAKLGIAVEVDGREHRTVQDAQRDRDNYERSGIKTLRVRNGNELDALSCLQAISSAETWNERRTRMGLKPVNGGG